MTADGFGHDADTTPSAFVQYKGTDICMDFYCECGAHCHFDGFFANAVKCPHCEAEWQMPWHLYPRRFDPTSESGKWHTPLMMDPDEDHSDDVLGADGINRWVPRPLSKQKGKADE